MDLNALTQQAVSTLMQVGLKVAGALALWLVGRWLIGLALRLLGRALARQNFDATLARYLQTGLKALLNIVLVVALLGYFGVGRRTSWRCWRRGVAIGVAWSGLLANFAAGTFLVFLRPFKVGDFVTAGGVTGTVDTISLFGTTINTPDNVHTIVGNNKIFGHDPELLGESGPARRPDRDHQRRGRSSRSHPDPERAGWPPSQTCWRPPHPTWTCCSSRPPARRSARGGTARTNTTGKWDFDTNRMIREVFSAAGFPAPMPTYALAGAVAAAPPPDAMRA